MGIEAGFAAIIALVGYEQLQGIHRPWDQLLPFGLVILQA
jgi:hypothetical protein